MGGVGVLAKGGDLEVEEEQRQRDGENKEEEELGSESGVSEASTEIAEAFEGIGDESEGDAEEMGDRVEEEEEEEEEEDGSSDSEVESSAL